MKKISTKYLNMDSYQKAEFIINKIIKNIATPNMYKAVFHANSWMDKLHYSIYVITGDEVGKIYLEEKPRLVVTKANSGLLNALEITDNSKTPFSIEMRFKS